jgi:phage regulator Rha-like protein
MRLIVSLLHRMKLAIQGLFQNVIVFMRVIGGIFRMMFQNILKFLRRTTTFIIDMYHAIIDMVLQFIKALWELMLALSLLLLLYIPGIIGILIDKFVWHHTAILWGSWGYVVLITIIGIFYRPEGATLLGQSDSDLTKFFASSVLADNHYFQFTKELVQRWKELRESIRTEESNVVIEHLKSVKLQYEKMLTACNDYCKQGIKIRHYITRKNQDKLIEELYKRQLEASATRDQKTRQNYLTTVAKIEDELHQIEFYKKKLERLDSYFIKVSATVNNVHSKVLQIGVSDDLQNLEGNVFQDLELETQAINEVLKSSDRYGFFV